MPLNKSREVIQAVVHSPQSSSTVICSFTFQPYVWCPNSCPAVSGRSPEAWQWWRWQTWFHGHVPVTRFCTLIIKSLREMVVLFYPMLLYLRKSIAFWKVPRLRPFVLLVRATCNWRWVWRNGRMILTGKTEVLGGKPVSVPLCPPQISRWMASNKTGPPRWEAGD
jgi:hypothetical protein